MNINSIAVSIASIVQNLGNFLSSKFVRYIIFVGIFLYIFIKFCSLGGRIAEKLRKKKLKKQGNIEIKG